MIGAFQSSPEFSVAVVPARIHTRIKNFTQGINQSYRYPKRYSLALFRLLLRKLYFFIEGWPNRTQYSSWLFLKLIASICFLRVFIFSQIFEFHFRVLPDSHDLLALTIHLSNQPAATNLFNNFSASTALPDWPV